MELAKLDTMWEGKNVMYHRLNRGMFVRSFPFSFAGIICTNTIFSIIIIIDF